MWLVHKVKWPSRSLAVVFDLTKLGAAPWGLPSEMVENSVADLICLQLLVRITFFRPLLLASLAVVPATAVFVLVAPSILCDPISLSSGSEARATDGHRHRMDHASGLGKESEVEGAREDEQRAAAGSRSLLSAKGHPLPIQEVSKELGLSVPATTALLRSANARLDGQGRLVGLGLTMLPTPHQVELDRGWIYARCAFDRIFFLALLGQPGLNLGHVDPRPSIHRRSRAAPPQG